MLAGSEVWEEGSVSSIRNMRNTISSHGLVVVLLVMVRRGVCLLLVCLLRIGMLRVMLLLVLLLRRVLLLWVLLLRIGMGSHVARALGGGVRYEPLPWGGLRAQA